MDKLKNSTILSLEKRILIFHYVKLSLLFSKGKHLLLCLQLGLKITGLQIRVHTGKLFFLFLNQNMLWVLKRTVSMSSYEHPNHMLKLMGKEINAILGAQTILIWTY